MRSPKPGSLIWVTQFPQPSFPQEAQQPPQVCPAVPGSSPSSSPAALPQLSSSVTQCPPACESIEGDRRSVRDIKALDGSRHVEPRHHIAAPFGELAQALALGTQHHGDRRRRRRSFDRNLSFAVQAYDKE